MNLTGQDAKQHALRLLLQHLESLQLAGVRTLRRPDAERLRALSAAMITESPPAGPPHAAASPPAAPAAPQLTPAPAGVSTPAGQAATASRDPAGTPDTMHARIKNPRQVLAELQEEVAGCTLCTELAATRTQTVFGTGNPHARLVFFGEAPGADEDRQGEPFVGRAGKLLTDIIEKGMKLRRQDVYILNTLKCRPPGNRTPTGDEVANCRPYFERQLEIIRPEFICCLGLVAAQTLLASKLPMARLRGQFYDYRGSRVLCTYHPAYLLRNPNAKKETWKDIQILMEAMGLPVS